LTALYRCAAALAESGRGGSIFSGLFTGQYSSCSNALMLWFVAPTFEKSLTLMALSVRLFNPDAN
jgi:hypothetical protein